MKKKKRILLAEDDQFISKAYEAGLKSSHFEVVSVYNGEQALREVYAGNVDLVLLDLIMPKKNGFEVLEEMQMDSKLKKIPVVILSNLGQESDIKKGMDLGAADYLVKSNFSMKDVIEKVKENLVKNRK
jgi:DNA-binding response OmpR family regulator